MFTQKELDNLRRSYEVHSKDILTPEAYIGWYPIILQLIEQAYDNLAIRCPLGAVGYEYYGDGYEACDGMKEM